MSGAKTRYGFAHLRFHEFLKKASVNEPKIIDQLADKMMNLGVKPELEVFDLGMINYAKMLIKKGIVHGPFYFNIILGNAFGLQMDPASVGIAINNLPNNSLWALGGIGKNQLSANMLAISCGGGVRVGLEDNLYFDQQKTKLASNISLIKRVHELSQISGRSVMKSSVFGKMGFYNSNKQY